MNFFIITGEHSGDLHGAGLVRALKERDADATVWAYAGRHMREAGAEVLRDYSEYSVLGFMEVLYHLPKILRNLALCKSDLLSHRPDALILIDFHGFNSKMARFARRHGIPVAFYIAPKLWIWGKFRIGGLSRNIDKMFVIFPFEVAFFADLNFKVTYVGNPVEERVTRYMLGHTQDRDDERARLLQGRKGRQVVAYLPGSRPQEIKFSVPIIREVAFRNPHWEFLVSRMPDYPDDMYAPLVGVSNVRLVPGSCYRILLVADAAVITSGTATLEGALLNCPMVVCYKTSTVSYLIGRFILALKRISLVNILLGKDVVPEITQHRYTPARVSFHLRNILEQQGVRDAQLSDFRVLQNLLGNHNVSANLATHVLEWMKSRPDKG